MGFIGDAIGGVTDMLTGGGNKGPVGYTSPYVGSNDASLNQGIYARLGAKRKLKPGAKHGSTNEADYEYDVTGATDPLSVEDAKKGYSGFGKLDTAMNKMSTYSPFSATYNSTYKANPYAKTAFNFQSMPEKAYAEAAATGSKDILRAGQGALTKLAETVGTRRPGLLLKGGEQANRDTGEQLAALQANLRGQQAQEKAQLSKEQQIAQAGENLGAAQFGEEQAQFKAGEGYKGYLSKADLEKSKAAEKLARDQGFGTLANQYLGQEQTATEAERAYKDRALEYLMDLFKTRAGVSSESARAGQASADARRGQTLGMVGSILGGK